MAKKILIVEDEKVLAEMYKDKFTQAGFEVVTAFDAREGLILAKKEKPDLILLDILLPRANGISFVEHLRKNREIGSTLVVAFSNYDDPETKKKAFELGVKDYLIKTNYTPKQIVEEIKEYLKNEKGFKRPNN